jgi:hypothetical protein
VFLVPHSFLRYLCVFFIGPKFISTCNFFLLTHYSLLSLLYSHRYIRTHRPTQADLIQPNTNPYSHLLPHKGAAVARVCTPKKPHRATLSTNLNKKSLPSKKATRERKRVIDLHTIPMHRRVRAIRSGEGRYLLTVGGWVGKAGIQFYKHGFYGRYYSICVA